MDKLPPILVVDDNEINLEIMQEILGDDFTLLTASNGSDALRLADFHAPQTVLLDIMLPGIDGLEICRRLRKMPAMRTAKIIMISAKAMASERAAGLAAGADGYLAKPFDFADLLAALRVPTAAGQKLPREPGSLAGTPSAG